MESPKVTVVGAGLAGCEVAYQLAERGIAVELREMKPQKRTPAQQSDSFSELVCSNSFRGASLTNAVGLLKEEMRRRGSLVMKVGDATAVPAGGAMAVDRERFAGEMTRAIEAHPRIHVVPGEVTSVPEGRPCVIATGPLTAEALADDLAAKMGQGGLAYYDAIAPIVAAHSIDWDKVFRGSRYGKGQAPPNAEASAADGEAAKTSACESESGRGDAGRGTDNTEGGDDAYVNCPFEKDEYFAFVRALVEAEKVEARSFEDVKYFEGCLPCEVMAERGERTLSFGPMKPVGLVDPRTGRRPYAVIQLRQEDEHMSAYNLVGFQTRMKHGEQLRVFRTVPGLENAEFMRLGSVHRNTFVDAPNVLDGTMQLKALPGVYLAGQITGVEGYVESAASGLVCAMLLADTLAGASPRIPPMTTALGALLGHLSRAPIGKAKYQPSNITWALFPPLEGINPRTKKRDRYELMAARALRDFEALA